MGLAQSLDPPHLPLSLSSRLTRYCCSIVGVLISVMAGIRQYGFNGWRVASQPICDEPKRLNPLSSQCLGEEPLRSFCVAPLLHQQVDDVAVLVIGAPKVVDPPADPDEYLIDLPGISQTALSSLKVRR